MGPRFRLSGYPKQVVSESLRYNMGKHVVGPGHVLRPYVLYGQRLPLYHRAHALRLLAVGPLLVGTLRSTWLARCARCLRLSVAPTAHQPCRHLHFQRGCRIVLARTDGSLLIVVHERLRAVLVDGPAPHLLLEELRPHLHLLALDVPIDVVCAEDAAVFVLLVGGIAHRWQNGAKRGLNRLCSCVPSEALIWAARCTALSVGQVIGYPDERWNRVVLTR